MWSLPGSGNTWVRHLIQEGTRVYAGSQYHAHQLEENGFPSDAQAVARGVRPAAAGCGQILPLEEAEGAVSEALDSAGVKNEEKNKFTMRAFWVMFDTFCAAPADETKGADKQHCSAALVKRRREQSAKMGIALAKGAALGAAAN